MSLRENANPLIQRFLQRPPRLEGGVELSVEPESERRVRLLVRQDDRLLELSAAPLSVPYPSGLRRLVGSDPGIQAVLVESIPSGLDGAASEMGVSYLDPFGHGRLVGPGFVYVVPPRAHRPSPGSDVGASDDSAPVSQARSVKSRVSPFAPKASRIVRALLADPKQPRGLSELAREVDLNPGNAHRVLSALLEMRLVERDHDQYVIVDPGSLLEAWAESYRPSRNRLSVMVDADVRSVAMKAVGALGQDGIVSGELAAELLAPHLPAHSLILHCISEEAWREAEESFHRGPVFPGAGQGRLHIQRSDQGVAQFGSSSGGLPLVSSPQLYVDLYRARGRAREAAEEMRKRVLGY